MWRSALRRSRPSGATRSTMQWSANRGTTSSANRVRVLSRSSDSVSALVAAPRSSRRSLARRRAIPVLRASVTSEIMDAAPTGRPSPAVSR